MYVVQFPKSKQSHEKFQQLYFIRGQHDSRTYKQLEDFLDLRTCTNISCILLSRLRWQNTDKSFWRFTFANVAFVTLRVKEAKAETIMIDEKSRKTYAFNEVTYFGKYNQLEEFTKNLTSISSSNEKG